MNKITPLIQPVDYRPVKDIADVLRDVPMLQWLDSASLHPHLGRYSFIAADPFHVLRCKNGVIEIDGSTLCADPFGVLSDYLALYPQITVPELPPFQGGVLGYFAYDCGRYLEQLPSIAKDDANLPDMMLGFYDVVLAFDHELEKSWIISSGYPEQNSAGRAERAHHRLEWMRALYESAKPYHPEPIDLSNVSLQSNVSRQKHLDNVLQCIEAILAGDIFQANITQRFCLNTSIHDKLALYCQLRTHNPAQFSAFCQYEDFSLLSNSPERFVQLQENELEVRPIKGTVARGTCSTTDLELANQLLSSEKDKAENIMIVDLMRNDLSKVATCDSVQVTQLCGLESFATVHHLVSVVKATLREKLTLVDVLRALIPGGSISGAPKIRAMEIIEALEPTRRGPYCGNIGYLGFDGAMDLSIVIRTVIAEKERLTLQVGGAVVADSDPQSEYDESVLKARALLKAMKVQEPCT